MRQTFNQKHTKTSDFKFGETFFCPYLCNRIKVSDARNDIQKYSFLHLKNPDELTLSFGFFFILL